MFSLKSKDEMVTYLTGNAPEGIYTVLTDETHYNLQTQYSFKNGITTLVSIIKIDYNKLPDVETKANLPAGTNRDMVVVLVDESQSNKTTWYTYNVDKWVLMGEYLGATTTKAMSLAGTRNITIKEDTNYTIPVKYTVGRNELSIFANGMKLIDNDFIEIGVAGVLSDVVQFKSAIMDTVELEFVRSVHSNTTIDPTFQISKDDSRREYLKALGYTYGGTIQNCKLRDLTKVYYCEVNQQYFKPKVKNLVPVMTANTNGTVTVSASSMYSSGQYPVYLAFDGDINTFHHNYELGAVISENNAHWIKVDLNIPTSITTMLLSPRIGFNNQFPMNYTIEGSSDDVEWTVLKTVVDNVTFGKGSVNDKVESLNIVGTNYRYYRIVITKTGGNMVSIANIALTNENGSWLTADADWATFLPTPNSGAVVTGL